LSWKTHSFTPNELFYTRNHNTVPNLSEDEYELIVEGNGVNRTVFTLHDLKTKFEHVEVVSTVQCAGNRGEDYHGIGNGPSAATFLAPHWTGGAISNAKWTGVRMRDLLRAAGMDVDGMANGDVYLKNGQTLKMWAYDADETGDEYGASTYMDKVGKPWMPCTSWLCSTSSQLLPLLIICGGRCWLRAATAADFVRQPRVAGHLLIPLPPGPPGAP